MNIGYNHAIRLIDLLEERGVIGPQVGAQPRAIFSSPRVFDWYDSMPQMSRSGTRVLPHDAHFTRMMAGRTTVPLYIVEIAPSKWRGLLVGLNQLNIVFGILASYVTNYLVARFRRTRPLCCRGRTRGALPRAAARPVGSRGRRFDSVRSRRQYL